METTEEKIWVVVNEIGTLLSEKNQAYGDSAVKPVNIFSKGNAVDSLCARIDDKIMRIKNKGINDKTEDTVSDLIGYLILLKIALKKNNDTK
jgi:hypothetical protein